jgi:hypothetical protein
MFLKNVYHLSLAINFILVGILIYMLFYVNHYYVEKKTYIKQSEYGGVLGGRGVFANRFIKKGEIIEEGQTLTSDNIDDLKCGLYTEYVYTRTDDISDSGLVFVLGDGGIYNHSYNNNAVIRTKNDTFTVFAIKDINKDEEIFTCYGCNHQDKTRHYDYLTDHEYDGEFKLD